jgi:transposase
VLRLRSALREFFPAALEAFADLTASDALELLAAAPDPVRAARLSRSRIAGSLKRAHRRDVEVKAEAIQAALRSVQLTQPAELTGAYAATVSSHVALIAALNTRIAVLGEQVEAHLADTRTLRSTAASPASVTCSAPGCSASSATIPTATTAPEPGRTTLARRR